jgi:quercetin dioxygenase-like cupin family protein
MLVNVEHGAANPSVGTLLKISDALGVGLPALVAPPQPSSVKVTRHGDGAILWRSDAGGSGTLLAGIELPDVLELWDWTLAPGDEHVGEAHTLGTRELVQVRRGSITITIANETIDLEEGDAASFAGDVVFEPAMGAGSRLETSLD